MQRGTSICGTGCGARRVRALYRPPQRKLRGYGSACECPDRIDAWLHGEDVAHLGPACSTARHHTHRAIDVVGNPDVTADQGCADGLTRIIVITVDLEARAGAGTNLGKGRNGDSGRPRQTSGETPSVPRLDVEGCVSMNGSRARYSCRQRHLPLREPGITVGCYLLCLTSSATPTCPGLPVILILEMKQPRGVDRI